jgi:hypothetical protein
VGQELGPDLLGRVYATAIDIHSNRWQWNCGWFRVDKDGVPIEPHKARTGHLAFRKHIKLPKPKDKATREVLHGMDRPGRAWRRLLGGDLYTHSQFGNCYMLATDGCHAVIETVVGDREYVCFENLTEYTGVALPPRPSLAKEKVKRERATQEKAKVSVLLAKYTQQINTQNES